VRTALVQLQGLPPTDREGRRELRSSEDAADPLGVVPVGVEDENALLIRGQAAHTGEYIEERANPAKVARSGPRLGQSDRRDFRGSIFAEKKRMAALV